MSGCCASHNSPTPDNKELHKSLILLSCNLVIQEFRNIRNLLIVPGPVTLTILTRIEMIEMLQFKW